MSTNAPVYQAISQVITGAPASIATINTPLTQITSNIQTIIAYLTNDGAGSGINADLLDGQHGSFYQNASNLNGGTLPAAAFADSSHGNRSGGTLHAEVTQSVDGFMIAADKAKLDGIAAGANNYSLPVATASVLGGVKQGSLITIAADGTISANSQAYTLPVATASVLGGVKQGSLITIAADGTISAANQAYTLPVASVTQLGGVKQGSLITIAADGTISANSQAYTLPVATASVLGGVKQGSLVNIDVNGVLSANVQSDNNFTNALLSKLNGIAPNANAYVLPIATTSNLGGVIVAGSYLSIDGSGNLSVVTTNLPLLNATSNIFAGNQYAPDFISQSNSDRTLKDNPQILHATDYDFSPLKLYGWDWNKKSSFQGHAVGTMADELATIVPHEDVVVYAKDGRATGINYGKAAFLLAMWLKEKLGV